MPAPTGQDTGNLIDPDAGKLVRPDKDFLQKDIDRSIDYRKEYYKYNIGIATALLAFTVSFPSTLSKIDYPNLIFAAWAGLGVAVLSAVATHFLWSIFFITWRDHDNRGQDGEAVRKPITLLRRFFDFLQIVGLIVGVGGVVVFAGLNLDNIAPKEKTVLPDRSTSSTPVPPGRPVPTPTPAPSGTTAPGAPAVSK
jgi:hypothetical protein